MKMAEPGWFMKTMILGAQGVFYNSFFLAYLLSPRICHRFVGFLEEEAVVTYTRAIADIDAGKLPKWQKLEAPEIAVRYWNMPEGHRTMRDLLLYIRADEAKHREVNHTLGNLEQSTDPNPFVSECKCKSPDKHGATRLTNMQTKTPVSRIQPRVSIISRRPDGRGKKSCELVLLLISSDSAIRRRANMFSTLSTMDLCSGWCLSIDRFVDLLTISRPKHKIPIRFHNCFQTSPRRNIVRGAFFKDLVNGMSAPTRAALR